VKEKICRELGSLITHIFDFEVVIWCSSSVKIGASLWTNQREHLRASSCGSVSLSEVRWEVNLELSSSTESCGVEDIETKVCVYLDRSFRSVGIGEVRIETLHGGYTRFCDSDCNCGCSPLINQLIIIRLSREEEWITRCVDDNWVHSVMELYGDLLT